MMCGKHEHNIVYCVLMSPIPITSHLRKLKDFRKTKHNMTQAHLFFFPLPALICTCIGPTTYFYRYRYASVNAMSRIEQSRRDDLVSLGYILVYLAKGTLPWQHNPGVAQSQISRRILEHKIYTNPEKLCQVSPSTSPSYVNVNGHIID